jgi:SAM-dependent MidA family methyltransferase
VLLQSLACRDRLPGGYDILELSADLRDRQREHIKRAAPAFLGRVRWLDVLPPATDAIVIANEVLDALPVHVVCTRPGGIIEELGLTRVGDALVRSYRPCSGPLRTAAEALKLPENYETEIGLAMRAFVKTVAERVSRGALLFIDYGFPAAEYYHPQRSAGTLMCHYRHHAHGDPLLLPGLQDISAHVDFTAVADAALEASHTVLGYTSQAQFLVNCGITHVLAETPREDARAYAPAASAAQKLLSPAEMGELFKVMALGRGIDVPLLGFASGDRTHTL